MDADLVGSASCHTRRTSVAIYNRDLASGGVERQILTLAETLQASGWAITLVLHQFSGAFSPAVPPGVAVVDLASRRTLQDISRLARFLRQARPDVLVSNLDHNNVAALVASRLSGTRTPVIICQHNALSSRYTEGLSRSYRYIPSLYRLLSPDIAAAVCVSEGLAGEMRRIAHVPPDKVHVIHNGIVDAQFFSRCNAAVRHPWFDDPAGPVFVTAGRLVALKDHETLLRALAMHRQHQPSRLLILGDGPLRNALEERSRALGLGDAVQFLGFQDNPLPWFRRADAFVLSSRSEGFGNVLVEALGCGTPVISTDCEHGPSEILANGRYGLLVPTQAPDALAKAMDRVGELRGLWPPEVLKARAGAFTTAACASAYGNLIQAVTRPVPAALR